SLLNRCGASRRLASRSDFSPKSDRAHPSQLRRLESRRHDRHVAIPSVAALGREPPSFRLANYRRSADRCYESPTPPGVALWSLPCRGLFGPPTKWIREQFFLKGLPGRVLSPAPARSWPPSSPR